MNQNPPDRWPAADGGAEALPTIPRVAQPDDGAVPVVPRPRTPGAVGDSAEKQIWYQPGSAQPAAPQARPAPEPPPQARPAPEPPSHSLPYPQSVPSAPSASYPQSVLQQHQWAPQPPPPAAPRPPQPQSPPWASPGPVPPLAPVRSSGLSAGAVVGIVVAALVLIAGGGAGVYLWQQSRAASSESAPVIVSSPTLPSDGVGQAGAPSYEGQNGVSGGASQPSTASPEQLEQQALAQLDALRAQSLSRLPLDGRWVAQVASKSVGITDPLQTAQNGSHTFYASDILAESLAARQKVNDPSEVYVVWGTDFGKSSQAADGSPYWITVVDGGFASSGSVTEWCQSTFSGLTSQQIADTCAPRQLVPPHS